MVTASAPSKGEINRSGRVLVAAWHGGDTLPDYVAYERALRVVDDYRACHSYPLGKVTMGLRSMVSTERCQISVTQRLKRMPRIVRKLARMEDSNLARLEDVGGCRAVLSSPDELQRVLKRVRKNWGVDIKRERDYITDPKKMGYRAHHVVVQRDGVRIEVQLRTKTQQFWADAIERADARLKLNMKDGSGPPEMERYFEVASEISFRQEYGVPIDPPLGEQFEEAKRAVISAGYYSR